MNVYQIPRRAVLAWDDKGGGVCYTAPMKIEGPKQSSDVKGKGAAKKSSGGDGAFKAMMDGSNETAGVQGNGLTNSINSIDALLLAQGTEDPAQQKSQKKMRQRANDLLDKLNELKAGLLTGQVTVAHMVSIADVAATHREKITDPELSALLDEVDLRAQIELTKLQIAKEKLG